MSIWYLRPVLLQLSSAICGRISQESHPASLSHCPPPALLVMNKQKPGDREANSTDGSPGPDDRPLDASTLFRGRQQVLIEHDGEIYRLLLTRNNKLLLQK